MVKKYSQKAYLDWYYFYNKKICRYVVLRRKGETTWEDQRIQYAEYKGASGGIAVSISACDDHQKSGDTTVSPYMPFAPNYIC